MYIAIDIGGTNIRVAASEDLNNPKFSDIKKLLAKDDYVEDIKNIQSTIESFGEKIEGIGIGIAGPIDTDGMSAIPPNLKDWQNKTIKKDFENKYSCRVILKNDSATAALGEAHFGLGKDKDFIFIIWGTGIGGSEIKNNRGIVEVLPFEPGHEIIIDKEGRVGACGHKGDLESYAGGASIQKHYGKKAKDLSEEEWEEIESFLARGIRKLIDKRPTDLIIMGGGISINQPKRVSQLDRVLKKELGDKAPQILVSKLHDNAGLYGAFGLLKQGQPYYRSNVNEN